MSRELLKPRAVPGGAKIRIVAPASFARHDRIEDGLKAMEAQGFRAEMSDTAKARGPQFFAGTAQERLADLHESFTDSETQAIVCLRGGYGSNYLLEGLDLDLIGRQPKPLLAYSDLTGVQLHLLDKVGLPAFHGPMMAADFYLEDGVHWPSFHAAITGDPYSVGAAEGLRVIRPGAARGTLYGGCLSILVAMLGTPWEPRIEGKLLFLEDTGAKPYQIDRMLWQLRAAGKLEGIKGLVFGEMLDCTSPGADPDLLEQVIQRFFADFEGPIAYGLRSGHVSRQNVTLTFGVQAELQLGQEARLKLLEPAVVR